MGLIGWIRDTLGQRRQVPVAEIFDLGAQCYVRELAFWSAANLLARLFSKCEFKTFVNGDEAKGGMYYKWNIEPNKNQNSSAFLQQLITNLCANGACLVVQTDDGQLLIADSYQHKEYAIYDDVFTQVTIKNYMFKRSFLQNEVLYFTFCNADVNGLLKGLYSRYGQLIEYAQVAYKKSRGTKGTLEIPATPQDNKKTQDTVDTFLSGNARKFLEGDNGILPLYKDWKYTELGNKTYANDSTRDIRAMIDDVFDLTARAFGIPPVLLRGDVAGIGDAMDACLTTCLDPLVDMIREEINRKMYGYDALAAGSQLVIDTKAVKHVDLLSVATSVDKLISSGAFCINDIRALVGESPIEAPWAYQHWITKNFDMVENLLNALGGG